MGRGMVEVNGAHLAYELSGNGTPAVLLHGFSLDMRSWDAQFTALAAHHTVLRYDMRGFGRSSPVDRAYSHVGDLVALLDGLALGSAHLVGLSLGANVALGCTLDHPDRVCTLVLVSSGLAGHAWQEERPPDAAMSHARRHGVEAARRFWLNHELFASTAGFPEAQASLTEIVGAYSGWHWSNTNPMEPFTATASSLGRVSVPTLVVSGGRDIAGYREIADVLAAGIPGARKLDLPGAGHMLPMEMPDEFNRAVSRFLDEADNPA